MDGHFHLIGTQVLIGGLMVKGKAHISIGDLLKTYYIEFPMERSAYRIAYMFSARPILTRIMRSSIHAILRCGLSALFLP